jgi:hypothetical protein
MQEALCSIHRSYRQKYLHTLPLPILNQRIRIGLLIQTLCWKIIRCCQGIPFPESEFIKVSVNSFKVFYQSQLKMVYSFTEQIKLPFDKKPIQAISLLSMYYNNYIEVHNFRITDFKTTPKWRKNLMRPLPGK